MERIEGELSWYFAILEEELKDQMIDWEYWSQILQEAQEDEEDKQ